MRYTRYPYSRSSFFGYFPTGVKWLLISNTAMFLLVYLGGASLQQHFMLLALAPRAVVYHLAVWQLFTYLFLHGGIGHLLFNMLSLWMFGSMLERDWGTRRFLKYYFVCGVGAGLCDVAVNALMGNWGTRTIGASGAIYGLLLAYFAVRTLMYAAALQADWDPDAVSFVQTLNVIQRSQWRLMQACSCQRPALRQALLHEVCQERVPPRRLRLQARVVKRTHSRYKRKWYAHLHAPSLHASFLDLVVLLL